MRSRLDLLLVQRGLSETRARARDAIQRGTVRVGGRVITKAGESVATDADIAIDDPAAAWVSRAALKLIVGLDAFGFDPAHRICLDIGASTGGFTQVLLARGARHVTAIDVGHGQLHPSLTADPRVTSIEGLNARDLVAADLTHAPEFIVTDVSFISLTLALPPALALAASEAIGVFLVKPQFEAGRDAVGKGGIVDEAIGLAATERIRDWLDRQDGWSTVGLVPSPIAGGDGNLEYLLGARRD